MSNYVQMSDDERFLDYLRQQLEISEKLIDLGKTGVLSLKSQRFQEEANHRVILGQQKEMADNKQVIESAKKEAGSIISMAKEEAQKIKNHVLTLKAEAATLKDEALKMKEEAEQKLWESKKEKVKA